LPAKVVSLINYKGGVGKTTSAVNIAANLARYYDKKVLLVDGDPQTNATAYVMNPEMRYIPLQKQGKTLRRVFEECGQLKKSFDIHNLIVEAVVEKDGRKVLPGLDLLPSDPTLIRAERWLATTDNQFGVLRKEIEKLRDDYDLVIIDCAPNIYALTKNCIIASDYYIIPLIPDHLSSIGLELLVSEIYGFSKNMEDMKPSMIKLEGVFFTKYRTTTRLHQQMADNIRDRLARGIEGTDIQPGAVKPYDTVVRDLIAAAEAAQYSLPLCIYKPDSDASKDFESLTEEFASRLS